MTRFWLKWTLGSWAAFVAAFFALFSIIDGATSGEGPEAFGVPFEIAFPVLTGLAAVSMSTVQAVILRHRVSRAWRWIPATALGMLVSFAISMGIIAITGEPETTAGALLSGIGHGVVVGGVVGSAQRLILRDVDPTKPWPLFNVLMVAAAAAIGDSIALSHDGGLGSLIIIFLWQAMVAIPLFRMVSGNPDGPSVAEAESPSRRTGPTFRSV